MDAERFEKLEQMIEQLSDVRKTSRKGVATAGTAGGLLVVVLTYFGQAQVSRLDTLNQGFQELRIEVTSLKSESSRISGLERRVDALREVVQGHEKEGAHGQAEARLLALENRLDRLEGG